jgi:hypothetical protein
MAQVELGRHEAETDLLPSVCMCCGADGAARRTQLVNWQPAWVYILLLLPFWGLTKVSYLGHQFVALLLALLVAAIHLAPYFVVSRLLQHCLLLKAPLCPRHWYHWQWRAVGIPCGVVALAATCVSRPTSFVGNLGNPQPGIVRAWTLLMELNGLAWLLIMLKLHFSMIRPTAMDERFVTLVNVHQRFADTVNRQHQDQRAESRPQLPRGSEQFFDPQA